MFTLTRTTEFTLVDKILQKVVGMLLDSSCLLVLIVIQSLKQFQTDDGISNFIGMPLRTVRNCLQILKAEKLIKFEIHYEMNEGKKKGREHYFIDYKSVIECIIFKYSKIMDYYNNSRQVEQTFYKCPNDNTLFPEYQAINYYDVVSHKFHCPECDGYLELVNTHDFEGNIKYKEVTFQMKMLKEDLEKLKQEYRSILDYPIYETANLNPITVSPISKQQKLEVRHRSYDDVIPVKRTKINFGPMPWEVEDEMVEVNKVVEEKNVMDLEEDIDIFKDIDYLQHMFLHPNKTFNQKECGIVLNSTQTSPLIPTVIRAKKLNPRCHSLISVNPQM